MTYPLLSAAFLFVLLMYPAYIVVYGWTDEGYVPIDYKLSFAVSLPEKIVLIVSYVVVYAVRGALIELGFDVDWLSVAAVQGLLALAYLYWL